MKPTDEGKREAMQDGFDDAQAGLGLDANPYLAEMAYGTAWSAGWELFHAPKATDSPSSAAASDTADEARCEPDLLREKGDMMYRAFSDAYIAALLRHTSV